MLCFALHSHPRSHELICVVMTVLCTSCLVFMLQSAAVLGLSRLVFEFAGELEGVVNRLLPAVLLLLRSQSREVIKAVLGFVKVGMEAFALLRQHTQHLQLLLLVHGASVAWHVHSTQLVVSLVEMQLQCALIVNVRCRGCG